MDFVDLLEDSFCSGPTDIGEEKLQGERALEGRPLEKATGRKGTVLRKGVSSSRNKTPY